MNVLIIDDSRLARLELRNQLQHCPGIEILGEAANTTEALQLIRQTGPDLLLLDIDMPDGDGFSLLQQLDQLPRMPHVIFVTAFDQYALKSFDFHAKDYLLKPVTLPRLKAALAKVPEPSLPPAMSMQSQVFIKDGEHCYFVTLADIYALEAHGNYTRVFFGNSKPLIYRNLAALEQKLPPEVFFRANRSWIINTQFIQRIEPAVSGGFEVSLNEKLTVEISRRQASAFKQGWSL